GPPTLTLPLKGGGNKKLWPGAWLGDEESETPRAGRATARGAGGGGSGSSQGRGPRITCSTSSLSLIGLPLFGAGGAVPGCAGTPGRAGGAGVGGKNPLRNSKLFP